MFYVLSVVGHCFVQYRLQKPAFSTYFFGKLVFCLSPVGIGRPLDVQWTFI